MGIRSPILAAAAAVLWLGSRLGLAAAEGPADPVVADPRVGTANPDRRMAEAIAVKDRKLVFVGASSELKSLISAKTQVMGGKLVLPGLFDSHIHPIDILKFDGGNLEGRAQRTRRQLSALLRGRIAKYPTGRLAGGA